MNDIHETTVDALIDDAIDILCDRRLAVHRPQHPTGWRTNLRVILHGQHDHQAHKFIAADREHAGTITLTARTLANLLEPPPASATSSESPAEAYARAEETRRLREAAAPDEWLDPETRLRCIADARAKLRRPDETA